MKRFYIYIKISYKWAYKWTGEATCFTLIKKKTYWRLCILPSTLQSWTALCWCIIKKLQYNTLKLWLQCDKRKRRRNGYESFILEGTVCKWKLHWEAALDKSLSSRRCVFTLIMGNLVIQMAAHAFPFSNKNTLLGAVSIIDRDVSYNTSLYSLCHCVENTAEILQHLGLYWNIV